MKATGRLPGEWQGRGAAEEERRLRDAGQWENGRTVFFEQWGKVDPAAAIAASRTTDPGAITVATAATVKGWMAADSEAAMAWVMAQPLNAEHAAFVGAVLQSSKTAGSAGNTEGAGGGSDGRDFPMLGGWLSAQLSLPSLRPVAREFVLDWSRQDRKAALAWTQQAVGDSGLRAGIQEALIQEAVVAGADGFQTTGQWLQEQPAGRGRDELLLAYVKETARRDAVTSAQWAALIEDEALRKNAEQICHAAAQAAPR